jgi:acetylornithine deacetylase
MADDQTIDAAALAAELLSIPSPSGDEGAVVEFVSRWLVARDWDITIQEVTPGRGNIWATRSAAAGQPGVTLSTHLDTVAPYVPPRREGDRLYGRGACDAKGIAAAMLAAATRCVANGEQRVGLLFLVGEEMGSDGARAASRLPATSRFLINGEPTESHLATGAKGSLRVTLRIRGREAHSAYPELGASAITEMLALLPRIQALVLPTDPVLGAATVNIGVLRAGTAANIIPGQAEAELMFRLVGDVRVVKRAIEACVGGTAEIEYGSYIPAQRFHVVPGFAAAPVAYTSDIPLLPRWGTPLLFGPGSIHVAHTPDEHIDLPELRASVDAYERIIRTLLAS